MSRIDVDALEVGAEREVEPVEVLLVLHEARARQHVEVVERQRHHALLQAFEQREQLARGDRELVRLEVEEESGEHARNSTAGDSRHAGLRQRVHHRRDRRGAQACGASRRASRIARPPPARQRPPRSRGTARRPGAPSRARAPCPRRRATPSAGAGPPVERCRSTNPAASMRARIPVRLGLRIWQASAICHGSSGPRSCSTRMIRHCCSVTPKRLRIGRKCCSTSSRVAASSNGRLRCAISARCGGVRGEGRRDIAGVGRGFLSRIGIGSWNGDLLGPLVDSLIC